MSSSDELREQRTTQILEAALEVFSRQGLHHTRMEDIAEAAGLSKGTLYWYFDSKEALISALWENWMGTYTTAMQIALEAEGSAAEQLERIALSFLPEAAALLPMQPLFYEIFAWALEQETIRESMISFYDILQEMMSDLVRRGIAQGEFKAVDPEAAAFLFLGCLEGVGQLLMLRTHPEEWEARVRDSLAVLLDALRPT